MLLQRVFLCLGTLLMISPGCEMTKVTVCSADFDCCSGEVCTDGVCETDQYPRYGRATLEARTLNSDYEAATISFKYGSVEDEGIVNNNWDLLFGNDADDEVDLLTVNTVTDDSSFIVDMGEISICDVPATVDPSHHELVAWGEHDSIPTVVGHLYVVRTFDSSHSSYAVFTVLDHDLNREVTLYWYRSADPHRFVPPLYCDQDSE